MKVPADQLASLLGVTHVQYVPGSGRLAIVDSTLAGNSAALAEPKVAIDNFTFSPATLIVKKGEKVVWTNRDDIPHTVVDTKGRFKSKALDTGDSFGHVFTEAGTYDYFCSLHAHMKGKVIVH
jgi:plastocyanin